MRQPATLALVLSAALLAACASTQIETTGTALKAPLCRRGQPPVSAWVIWGTQWRADQKEPEQREAAALRGIQAFAAGTDCLAVVALERAAARPAAPAKGDLMQRARNARPAPDRVVHVTVRELGPTLRLGGAGGVEGGTEAVIDVRVLDARTGESLAAGQTRWRNGGALVVKGVQTLDQDMHAALRAALLPGAAPQ